MGLTNHDSEDLSAYIKPSNFDRSDMKGFCTSRACAGSSDIAKRFISEAQYPMEMCPRCGFALMWQHPQKRKRKHAGGNA